MSDSPSIYLQVTNWLKSTFLGIKPEIPTSSPDVATFIENRYLLTQAQRDWLIQEFSSLQKQNTSLQQSLREQQTQTTANTEDLFLELLEVTDALEALLNYLENNPDPSPEFFQRLPKSVGAVHRKFLSVLSKRQVLPIELQSDQPDFNFCRVVDREIRDDVEDQTITKIVRQGFLIGEKVLRPTEIITSKSEQS
ncbi:nucleotide exchange factor GrpE [Nostoc parmelioides]|uniref:Nucleotide exchange factor GrpE n=1 Tax=Nostoc parmelioides FACHB-3921 TaxID=2692909 RepID=A0ABR8BBI4_9NOSO|nr:nucleotide exchange factor GrpE [Nostoc parmelioides FACHB-3921]